MIQLSTQPLPGLLSTGRAAGFPLATTSDFALALADLAGAPGVVVAPPAPPGGVTVATIPHAIEGQEVAGDGKMLPEAAASSVGDERVATVKTVAVPAPRGVPAATTLPIFDPPMPWPAATVTVPAQPPAIAPPDPLPAGEDKPAAALPHEAETVAVSDPAAMVAGPSLPDSASMPVVPIVPVAGDAASAVPSKTVELDIAGMHEPARRPRGSKVATAPSDSPVVRSTPTVAVSPTKDDPVKTADTAIAATTEAPVAPTPRRPASIDAPTSDAVPPVVIVQPQATPTPVAAVPTQVVPRAARPAKTAAAPLSPTVTKPRSTAAPVMPLGTANAGTPVPATPVPATPTASSTNSPIPAQAEKAATPVTAPLIATPRQPRSVIAPVVTPAEAPVVPAVPITPEASDVERRAIVTVASAAPRPVPAVEDTALAAVAAMPVAAVATPALAPAPAVPAVAVAAVPRPLASAPASPIEPASTAMQAPPDVTPAVADRLARAFAPTPASVAAPVSIAATTPTSVAAPIVIAPDAPVATPVVAPPSSTAPAAVTAAPPPPVAVAHAPIAAAVAVAAPPLVAPAAPAPVADRAAPSPVTVTVVALPSAPPIAVQPLQHAQPAAQAFAAAMFAAAAPRTATDENADDVLSLSITPASTPVTPQPTIAVAAPAQAQQPTLDLSKDDWMASMIDRIETLRDESGGVRETRMKLAPEALGNVEVSVRRDESGAIQVRIAADTAQARAMLTEAAPKLAEMAEARGVKLGGSSVDSGNASADQNRRDAQASTPLRNRPVSAAADATDTITDSRLA